MKKKRKNKRGLRYDRIFMLIFVIIAIILLSKLVTYISYNNKVYKEVTNSKNSVVSIYKKYNKLKIYNKTIDYLKKNKKSVKINSKKYSITINTNNIKKKMDLNVNLYNKKLDSDFNNSKAYFIDNKGILLNSSKITIKLPNYLLKNKIVDIYGITNDNKIEEIKLKEEVKNSKVSITLNKKYSSYFITYVKLKYLNAKDLTVYKGSTINLNLEYIPKRTTIKDIEYIKIGDIFSMENNKLIANKKGTDKVVIKAKNSNIKKEIKIKVIGKSKKEPKIEVKDGLTYVNGILIVNKTYSLPKDYNPGKLNTDAYNAFEKMKEAASKDNIKLWIASGYRSYTTQDNLYNYYLKNDSKEKVDTYSARPGHSEHQTGYAMDLNIIDSSFEGTPEAIWIEKNCYKYGFIIRYPKGKEQITGYKYEPWHVRYLGEEIAKKVHDSTLTLEEYLNIDSKYSE